MATTYSDPGFISLLFEDRGTPKSFDIVANQYVKHRITHHSMKKGMPHNFCSDLANDIHQSVLESGDMVIENLPKIAY